MAMADPESFAGQAGSISVTAGRDDTQVTIRVADHGPGLPKEEVDHVFTPFYRVEASRDRASGGVGLGLSIVKNCVETCKGTARCRNRVSSGLEVEIRLAAVNAASAKRD